MKRKGLLLASGMAALFVVTLPAQGLFGLPQIVYDPVAVGKAIEELSQLATTNEHWNKALEMMSDAARVLPSPIRAAMVATPQPYYGTQPNDVFGETMPWQVLLSGVPQSTASVGGVWTASTVPFNPVAVLPSLGGTTTLRTLAAMEIQDAAARNAVLTSANTRAYGGLNSVIIQNLTNTCMGDGFLSADYQANCTTAAQIVSNNQAQVSASIQAAQLDLMAAHALDERNKKVQQLNHAGQEMMDSLTRVDVVTTAASLQYSALDQIP